MTDRTSGASRFYKSAVATSALPLIAIGSAAAATPAAADAPRTALTPKSATDANVAAAQQQLQIALKPASELAVQLPARFTQNNFRAAPTTPATYTVQSGDTLGHIALKQEVSLSDLLKWNDLKASTTLFPGDVLNLGSSGSSSSASTASSSSSSYTVRTGDTLSGIAAKQNVSLSTLLNANGLSMSSIIYPGQTLKLSGSTPSKASTTASTASSTSTTSGTYKVQSGDTLSGIAAQQNVSLSTLLNANGLSASSIIYPGQQLKLSGNSSSTTSSSSSDSSSSSSSANSHTVRSGDTLSGIAARNDVSLSSLLKANGLSLSSTIFPGQTIKLSGSTSDNSSDSTVSTASSGSTSSSSATSGGSYTVKSGDTLSGIAARQDISLSTLLDANGLKSTSAIYPGDTLKLSGSSSSSTSSSGGSTSSSASSNTSSTYTVKSGDTLSGIASRNGVSLQALLDANDMSSTTIIKAGQTLQLSGSGSASTASSNDEQLVGNTFLDRTYPDEVVADANANKRALLDSSMPSRSEIRQLVSQTASSMGVDPALALAHAQIESGFDATAVSPANAIGTMQVIPSSGEWASQLVGRELNIMDPQDNITAGVAIIRHLQNRNPGDTGIAGYYQGEGGVAKYGMYDDTKDYVKKINDAKKRY
ncbi:MAG: LysM peptidoglycan-binding domain-containing protein [Micrococcaceae bacterium]|nr:LysM peptidoglycan-binding domain-containing protein [Micrococcaceae bacterium]